MLIIDNSSTRSIRYNNRNTKIRLVNEDNLYKLKINGVDYATSDSYKVIQILYTRLMAYCERYRRRDDTFDIPREMKIIENEVKSGKFADLVIDIDNLSMSVGYPTYTS